MGLPEQRKGNLKRAAEQCGTLDGFFATKRAKVEDATSNIISSESQQEAKEASWRTLAVSDENAHNSAESITPQNEPLPKQPVHTLLDVGNYIGRVINATLSVTEIEDAVKDLEKGSGTCLASQMWLF